MERLPERLDLMDPIYYKMVEEGVSSFWCQVRGNNYINSGQLNKAEEEFKKALQAKPNAASHTSLGYVYQRQKRFENALDHYKTALEMDPKFSGALNNMAVLYYELGDINMAVKMVKDALKADPKSLDGYLNLGTFYKVMGRKGEAIENFRIGHDNAPDDMRYMYQLGWLLAVSKENNLRNGKEALQLAEIVCKYSDYNNAGALDLLAAAHAENKQFDKALDFALQAYQLALREGNKKLAAEIKKRSTLYRNNTAYRE